MPKQFACLNEAVIPIGARHFKANAHKKGIAFWSSFSSSVYVLEVFFFFSFFFFFFLW